MKRDYFTGGKVISIHPMRQQKLFPALGTVESYWEGLRDGRLMPARAEVDPRGISNALEFAFVLEKIAPGLARIRLAGMHMNELMAMEVRGMPVTALFLPEARREMQRVLTSVLDAPAVVRLTLAGDSGLGRGHLEGQMILMPLRDESGAPTRILGALQSRGEIGRGPRRFTIRDVETKPLLGDPLTTPRRPVANQDGYNTGWTRPAPVAEPQGMAEPLHPFSPRSQEFARRIDAVKRAGTEADGATKKANILRLVYDADRL